MLHEAEDNFAASRLKMIIFIKISYYALIIDYIRIQNTR